MNKNLLIVFGVTVGIAASIGFRLVMQKPSIPLPTIATDLQAKKERDEKNRREVAWKIIAPRVEIAQEEILKCAEKRSQEVAAFFSERKKRVPAFADRVLSFRSKFELGKSKLPGADANGHRNFLSGEFNNMVFSKDDLKGAINETTENYVRDVKAIENALLVQIRADLLNLPGGALNLQDLKSDAVFNERFTKVIGSLPSQTGKDIGVDVGRLVGSEIAAAITVRVGVAVATRLGVSTGILGVGTAAGPETLGISVVAGVIVDQVVGWIMGWFYDPASDISQCLNSELDQLSTLIVNGDAEVTGLKQELISFAEKRTKLREQALREVIAGS